MSLLDKSTILIREIYHKVDPVHFPKPIFQLGRPLNVPESTEDENDYSMLDGHKIVYVNEVFEDNEKRKYRVIDVLGNGTFSYVFKCQLVDDYKQYFALKIIKNLPQYRATGVSEILIHQILSKAPDHPGKKHVIMPISTFEIDGHICVVMPLLSRSLFEGIYQASSPATILESVRSIMKQLLSALAFVHQNNIIHCDVKPDNILYGNQNPDDIILIDFGSATTNASGQGQYIQSRFYRSFEVMMGLPFNYMIDIWSAGCVAAELFLDFAIFACDTESDAIHTMNLLLGPVPEHLLSTSKNWWKFYDMTPSGFKLKMNPRDVLMQTHLYHSVFQNIGAVSLQKIIMSHCSIETQTEMEIVKCFSHFVHGLLQYDTNLRYSAEQALVHPFITKEPFTENWSPPEQLRKPLPFVEKSSNQMTRTVSLDAISTNDFLSLL